MSGATRIRRCTHCGAQIGAELCAHQQERARKSAESRKGSKRTAEQRARISEGTKQAWAGGVYEDTDFSVPAERRQRISEAISQRWAEGAYEGRDESYRTPEHYARHSQWMKENGMRPPIQFGPLAEEHRVKISNALRGIKRPERSEEHRRNLGASLRAAIMRGDHHPCVIKRTFHYPTAGIYFRSQSELIFAQKLDEFGIEWVYEPQRFDLGWATYLPDFYLPNFDLYVEVKGYMDDVSARKIASFRELGYPLRVVNYDQARSDDFCLELMR